MIVQVKDVMTRNVISVGPNESVLKAAQLMLLNRIGGVPVIDMTGKLVGIVTEGDFLRRIEIGTQRQGPKWLEFLIGPGRMAAEYVRTNGKKIAEIMTPDPFSVTEDDLLETVVELMERHRIKGLPVIRGEQIVGFINRGNLMHGLVSLARDDAPLPAGDDSAIRDRILEALDKEHWAPRANVVVKNGIAELWGSIMDERERQALIVATENIRGVKLVHDHLVWVEPMFPMAFLSPEDEVKAKAEVGSVNGSLA